jgi:UDP-N-acetylglucosamine 1-carboxyvinyltransferase
MDLIAILQKMGAIISVETDRTILIEGVDSLSGYRHTAIFDRSETASWAAAALATRGTIFVRGARQQELMTFLNVYRKVGGEFTVTDDGIEFRHPGSPLQPVVIETDVHPGFMTDWQQPMVVALTQAEGTSPSFTKPCTRTGSGSPTRSSTWARTSPFTRKASRPLRGEFPEDLSSRLQ